MNKLPRSVGVHDGAFHADEVTACALLLLCGLIDKDKIVRTRNADKLKQCEYVCDVGGVYNPSEKLFDHHQAEYIGDLSSAGMVLEYLKSQKFLTEDEWHFFNYSLVKGVDDHDNGKFPLMYGVTTFSLVIANFVPTSYDAEEEELNHAFFQALEFAYGHLQRLKNRYMYNAKCRVIVKNVMDLSKICLFFDRPIPWQESFFALGGEKHPALFVIMPSGEHWKLRGIPPNYENRMKVRLSLPSQWAGLLGEPLQRVTGIKGAVFCHKGLFTSVWETKEDALQAFRLVLKYYGIKDNENCF